MKREEAVRKLLAREHEVIRKWNESANVSEQIKNVQGKVNFLNEDHFDVLGVDFESTDNASMDKNHPSTYKESTYENYLSNKVKSTDNKKLRKLKTICCHIDNFTPKKEIESETKTETKKVNVGFLSNKQLKDKIKNINIKTAPNNKTKKNRNGKVGINKHNNYAPDMHAPRKVFSKYGSVNHLSMHCKFVTPSVISPSMPALVDQNFSCFTQLPYLPNPYFQYGNLNMPSMSWGYTTC